MTNEQIWSECLELVLWLASANLPDGDEGGIGIVQQAGWCLDLGCMPIDSVARAKRVVAQLDAIQERPSNVPDQARSYVASLAARETD